MDFLDELALPQFPSARACEAAEIEQATLKNWISRKPSAVLLTEEERAAFGESTRFQFTLRRVLQIAITAELVRLGFGPRQASMIAAGFTDVGDTAAYWGDEEPPRTRAPGELYPEGSTLLLAFPNDDIGRVMNASHTMTWPELLWSRKLHGRATTAVIINVNNIVMRVRAKLGLSVAYVPGSVP